MLNLSIRIGKKCLNLTSRKVSQKENKAVSLNTINNVALTPDLSDS